MRKLISFLLVTMTMTVFSQGNRPLSINPEGEAGSRSLTGSYITFDPSVGEIGRAHV